MSNPGENGSGLEQARAKMTAAGVDHRAIEVFSYYYGELQAGATGLIPEDTITALDAPPLLTDAEIDPQQAKEALGQTVIIKLNGGLGTSMGLDKAKSLLPVRDGKSFLDLIVDQVLAARHEHGVKLPLLFMNSFRTRDDTLAALAEYDDLAVPGLELDFLQNQEPKLLKSDLTPVEWAADPSLEWCPPGHGDLYTALEVSGVLKSLLSQGYRYASVSNADNLGAAPNVSLAGWFAASGAPYAAEICRRTAADRKGGHLAIRKSDGQLILRDTAQTPPDEMDYFTDEHRHPFFHTNNLWFDLQVLHDTLSERESVLGLPLIKNEKTVDPSDASSPEVIQIETAMGAAIEVFEGATAIGVGRERFVPVKTTNDLLMLRSDAYRINDDATLTQVSDQAPLVDLDPRFFKKISAFEERFGAGAPSFKEARSLKVLGDWSFGAGVRVIGDVELAAESEAQTVPDDTVLGE